ncbi:MAG: ParB N-terminal domain-containing protein [Candidatus Methylopumilus sp.]
MAKIETLKLLQIELVPALQTRVEMSPNKVRDYENAYTNGAVFPPVLVARAKGQFGDLYKLLDGWHRIQALINTGASQSTRVPVRIVDVPEGANIHYLRFLGGKENLNNGLGLNGKDKRELFKAYVKGGANRDGNRYKPYREMAKELTLVTHHTIRNWMEKEFPTVFKKMSKDEPEEPYPNNTEGVGQRLVDMPDLTSRERDLFADSFINQARQSDRESREQLRDWLTNLGSTLDKIAPPLPADEPCGDHQDAF